MACPDWLSGLLFPLPIRFPPLPSWPSPQFARKIGLMKPEESRMSSPSTVAKAFSTESGRAYQLDRLTGKGGFVEVYLATPIPQDGLPSHVRVKVTDRLSRWLREAYFVQLLFCEARAVSVVDRVLH